MKVILMKIDAFDVIQLSGVTMISYDAGTKIYTITHSGGTSTYSGNHYHINVLW